MIELKGIAAVSGYAAGRALLLKQTEHQVARRTVSPQDIEQEISRFEEHAALAIEELEDLRDRTRETLGETQSDIFSTHISILQDEEFTSEIIEKMKADRINAEAALTDVTNDLIALFESMDNEYIKERSADFLDVRNRVLRLLNGGSVHFTAESDEPVIVFADDLSPSDTAQLDRSKTLGFATRFGGKTAHSAIIARSMGIPAIVGLKENMDRIQTGDCVLLDGHRGVIYLNPTKEMLAEYKRRQIESEIERSAYFEFADKPSITADGVPVELAANIGNLAEAHEAKNSGAEGIGLFRTEFLYMGRTSLPTEEEQFQSYKAAAALFGPDRPVVIRTLDIGGDKELPYLSLPKESNPFLGYRAIRLCLDQTDIFKTQLRAILRASHYGHIKIMYPMIATLQELRQANELLSEVGFELDQAGIPYNRDIDSGIMIEVPAAAIIADQLAKEADFFSIGTNDLVQYTLAADRMNAKVSYLTQPFHPAVLRLIYKVIKDGHSQGKWVGMCGEMAGDPTAIPILLGMGLDEFSMSARSILPARALISRLKRNEMKRLAEDAMMMDSAEEIQHYIRNTLNLESNDRGRT